ncbi:MAG: homoserine kinase [bacterium]|nr:homoserine kinase [Gammaproteobacteria bacterium]
MAVFTTFKSESLARHLIMYDQGELGQFKPIDSGIENSNYFVSLINEQGGQSEFVLTITENISFDEMPFFNSLMSHLFHYGLPVPNPQSTLDGMTGTSFCGKPTVLVPKLPGDHPVTLTTEQCHTIGIKLAELHEAAQGVRYHRSNPYSSQWVNSSLDDVQDRLTDKDRSLLQQIATQYAELESAEQKDLPRGIIHGDLFRDNALFVGEKLTGIIDFYHACEDFLVQDIAITINDWCTSPEGDFDAERQDALLKGYHRVRELTKKEKEQLPGFQQFAALRFILTRLLSGGDNDPLKDPEEILRIARQLYKQ